MKQDFGFETRRMRKDRKHTIPLAKISLRVYNILAKCKLGHMGQAGVKLQANGVSRLRVTSKRYHVERQQGYRRRRPSPKREVTNKKVE